MHIYIHAFAHMYAYLEYIYLLRKTKARQLERSVKEKYLQTMQRIVIE